MSAPVVSILLPVRDGAAHLGRALDSLAAQTLTHHEVLVVDDGSRDSTPEILERRAAEDPRVQVLTTPPRGIVAALETARAAAAGAFLARMDADDIAHPGRLEAQRRLLDDEPTLAACGTRVRYFPEDRVRGGARRYERWINSLVRPDDIHRDLFVECPLPHPTFFLRADAVEAVGGYRERGWPEDYDLLLRLREAGGRLGKVPRVLLRWREHPARLSRVRDAYSAEAFRRCKVHHLRRTILRGRAGVVVWGAGPTGKHFARAAVRGGVTLRAFVDLDPRKVGQEIHGAPVIPPDGVGAYADGVVLAAVGQEGAREEIRRTLRERGLEEMEDFVAVA